MELNYTSLKDRQKWETLGYSLPAFDEVRIKKNTSENPEWVHLGAGNIFRAYQAQVVQELLNDGVLDKGIIVVEGYDYEVIEKIYKKHDCYSILVTLKADGTTEKTVIGSVTEALTMDRGSHEDWGRLEEIFTKNSLKMVSFTITEKGYSLADSKGVFLTEVLKDIEEGPAYATSYLAKVTALLYERFKSGGHPIALVSMDNCSHNGDKLYQAIYTITYEWLLRGKIEKGFLDYITNPEKVSFPWSMIDKITPRPDEAIKALLVEDGIEEMTPIVTTKNTYIAPFVNAEEAQYLVIEDAFPNGKLPLNQGGIIYTSKETVDQVEKMKVCTCLNPLHTTLAIFGCLLGYELISEAIKDPYLKKLVEQIGYQEGLPVVVDPKIIKPEAFIKEVLEIRIPNPYMPDTPQRIATDTSQKLGIRFGETIKAYLQNPQLEVDTLVGIPFVFAGWLRYLMAVDDRGNVMPLSADPLLEVVGGPMKQIKLGTTQEIAHLIKPILSQTTIFGVDVYAAHLDEKIVSYFKQMIEGPGAVYKTLKKVVETCI